MFECKGCKELRAENERLHKLIERLLDRVAGPDLSKENDEPERPPAIETVKEIDEAGNEIMVERHIYGG